MTGTQETKQEVLAKEAYVHTLDRLLILYRMKRKQVNSVHVYHFGYLSLCFLFIPLEYVWRSRIKREREDIKARAIDQGGWLEVKSFYKMYSWGYLYHRILKII